MYRPQKFSLAADGVWPGNRQLNPYVFTEETAIAVDVAFATNRPLLVSGPPGSGKTALAPTLAAINRWRYLAHTFTSRTRLEDLTGDLDQLRRLSDAQARRDSHELPPKWAYLQPGILWWTYRPETALLRGGSENDIQSFKQRYGIEFEPPEIPKGRRTGSTVLLFDEIDKAEPDIPNDLLEPLDERRFSVPQGPEIAAPARLKFFVVVTTNGERELPPAFLRRCVNLELKAPNEEQLVEIAAKHFPGGDSGLHTAVARRVISQQQEARQLDIKPPSTSEYLDAIKACRALDIKAEDGDRVWELMLKATLIKESRGDEDEEQDDSAW